MIKYSIIIPVHNNGESIEQTMTSVLAQATPFDEIILVENGSKDDSLAKARQYEQNDARVQVIINEQVGLSHARNVGIKAARGEYIFLLDGDDTIEPGLLSQLDAAVNECLRTNTHVDMYEVNFNHYFSTKTYAINPFILPQGSYRGDEYLNKTMTSFAEESKWMAWRFLYRRNFFIAENRAFDDTIMLFEDIAFMHTYLTKDVTIYVTGATPLINYLFYENSLTRSNDAAFADGLTQVYRSIPAPSALQKTYFLSLAAKMLTPTHFIAFATNEAGCDEKGARKLYQQLERTRFFGRLRRRWQRAYGSKV